ncbi:MAG: hypothetical protein FJ317_02340 [SAR202 cluster bacterium]|nr:hypothetical protein [SAR202 cluster bacterium]
MRAAVVAVALVLLAAACGRTATPEEKAVAEEVDGEAKEYVCIRPKVDIVITVVDDATGKSIRGAYLKSEHSRLGIFEELQEGHEVQNYPIVSNIFPIEREDPALYTMLVTVTVRKEGYREIVRSLEVLWDFPCRNYPAVLGDTEFRMVRAGE